MATSPIVGVCAPSVLAGRPESTTCTAKKTSWLVSCFSILVRHIRANVWLQCEIHHSRRNALLTDQLTLEAMLHGRSIQIRLYAKTFTVSFDTVKL
jgi:hypothetical protein